MSGHHFICYSTVDAAEFALRLATELSVGPPRFQVWMDKRNIREGLDWDEQIAQAVEDCASLLFVLTPDSVEPQSECRFEWTRALRLNRPVVPLRLAPEVELPFRLGNRQAIDFSADFQAGLDRLRRHLDWLSSEEGVLKTRQEILADCRRDLRRARSEAESQRIRRRIDELTADIDRLLSAETREAEVGKQPAGTGSEKGAGGGDARRSRGNPAAGSGGGTSAQPSPDHQRSGSPEPVPEEIHEYRDVYAFGTEAPPPDIWYRMLRPVLHQASHYSVPTYYLDENLKVIDWNVAFELVFSDLVGKIRNKHVNWFIVRLENRDEVFEHARRFTEEVRRGALPLVDLEPLRYRSARYGSVLFEKVASQLHDRSGRHCGWAVALFLRTIDWPLFREDLRERIWQDKLWSVYAAHYDPVLQEYPRYHELIEAVTSVPVDVPSHVIDLGSGTGNCTAALVRAGHRVTSVENNLSMLDWMRAKKFRDEDVTIVKGSVEHLEMFDEMSFDAAVMMNVLYAVDDPLACLHGVQRILKPGAPFSYSTTHADIQLTPLLDDIRQTLIQKGQYEQLAEHYLNLREANQEIESTIARRFTREEYLEWTEEAGFELLADPVDTYQGAVMLVRAKRR